ncbi:galactose-1-phosphate uridylyltransferase [Candidatus Woesearchaeota archaeon]|nr:galactose-1-phosphate uridylyltransferase [Candidatus Woesearchaeota archaeon]
MGILRKDYILDRWVYYAAERKKRRMEFKEESPVIDNKICFFCPGNENLTPKEIGRVEYKDSWKVRWFPNKFPAVELKGNAEIKAKNKFLREGKAYGFHEVIAETRDHEKQLSDLSAEHIKEILGVYALRIKALSKLKGIKYVVVFKNQGHKAGTSLVHSHTQIAAISILPESVMEEIKAAKKFKKCPYCSIIGLESKSKRNILENKSVIAFAPYASRFNFEAWIFPKRHVRNITEMYENELYDMAFALKKILLKLKELNASYNFFLHYAPKGTDLHFHIEVTPRIGKFGGFEYSTGAIINSVTPEEAARFYRGK